MTLRHQKLEGTQGPFVAGDAFTVNRNITGIPAGRTLAKAWLTIKQAPTDADPGILQKVITPVDQPGIGHISDTGAGDQEADLRFDVTALDSTAIGAARRFVYDVQLMLDNDEISTYELGTVQLIQGVTAATS